jgi:iron(III) transport system substrate-binding protein
MPRLAFLIAAALALLLAPVGRATAAVPPDVLAAAKREGVVVWYTSIGLQFLTAITKRFEATHPGLTLQTFRSPANLLPARILTEQRSGKFSADVVNADNIPLAQLRAAGALDPKFEPRSLYMTTTVLAWNAQKLKADGLRPPATLADLAKPEWRGKIGIDSTAYNWYQAVIETAPGARDLLKAIADNHPFIVAGHDAVVAQLGAGEFDVTPTAYGFLIEQGRLSGLPIAFLNPRPLFVDESPVALAKNAPHPKRRAGPAGLAALQRRAAGDRRSDGPRLGAQRRAQQPARLRSARADARRRDARRGALQRARHRVQSALRDQLTARRASAATVSSTRSAEGSSRSATLPRASRM